MSPSEEHIVTNVPALSATGDPNAEGKTDDTHLEKKISALKQERPTLLKIVTTSRYLFLAAVAFCTGATAVHLQMNREIAGLRGELGGQDDQLKDMMKRAKELDQQMDRQRAANQVLLAEIAKLIVDGDNQKHAMKMMKEDMKRQGEKIPHTAMGGVMQKELNAAWKLLHIEKDAGEAADACTWIVLACPPHYPAWELKGDALGKIGKDGEARYCYRTAVQWIDDLESHSRKTPGLELAAVELPVARERIKGKLAALDGKK